jgi:hypothetical protein
MPTSTTENEVTGRLPTTHIVAIEGTNEDTADGDLDAFSNTIKLQLCLDEILSNPSTGDRGVKLYSEAGLGSKGSLVKVEGSAFKRAVAKARELAMGEGY